MELLYVSLCCCAGPDAGTPGQPKADAPKLEAPKLEAPKIEAPKLPKIEAPKIEAPKIEAPKLPKVGAPKAEAPKLPKVEAPKLDVPKPPKVEAPKLEAPKPPSIPTPQTPALPQQQGKACPCVSRIRYFAWIYRHQLVYLYLLLLVGRNDSEQAFSQCMSDTNFRLLSEKLMLCQ